MTAQVPIAMPIQVKRSSHGVPRLVEQFIESLSRGEVWWLWAGCTLPENKQTHKLTEQCVFKLFGQDSFSEIVRQTMQKLRNLTSALLEMPHYLVPLHGRKFIHQIVFSNKGFFSLLSCLEITCAVSLLVTLGTLARAKGKCFATRRDVCHSWWMGI